MSAIGRDVVDAQVVDLFAGSGALGLEALSRGAASVVFVERARASLRALRSNVDLLDAGARSRVVEMDVFRFLAVAHERFDIAFADPPYGGDDARRLVEAYVGKPFANALWLEHPSREALVLPDGARTRRYGDTALTTLTSS